MKTGEIIAAAIVVALGGPFVYMFGTAVADGNTRAREAPLRAILGNAEYEDAIGTGGSGLNYVGRELLAPDFSLPDKDGRPWRLSDHLGKVVVMNFWSITCQPCVEEMPSLMELARLASHRDDFEVVAISTDGGWEEVARLFPPEMDMPVLFDSERRVVRGMYGTRLYPETWFIDARGVIRARVDGKRDWSLPVVIDLIGQMR